MTMAWEGEPSSTAVHATHEAVDAVDGRRQEVAARVLEVFVRETEYEREHLAGDLKLEGDLGIDSVMQLTIWEELGAAFGVDPSELQAADLSTIDEVVAWLCERPQSHALRQVALEPAASIEVKARPVSSAPAEQPAQREPSAKARDVLATWVKPLLGVDMATLDRDATFAKQGISPAAWDKLVLQIARRLELPVHVALSDCDSLTKLTAFLDVASYARVVPVEAQATSAVCPRQADADDTRTMQDFHELRAPDLFEKARSFHAFYRERRAEDLYWYGMALQSAARNRAIMYDEHAGKNREFVLMATNNYLGLATHPDVVDAIRDAAQRYGSTHTGCRLIGGTNAMHKELERDLAAFKGTESCIIFPSGYSANLGTISALVRRHDVVISDKYNHMSIADGCKLASGATRIYQHSDIADLERVVSHSTANCDGKLIVTDGVFSMHGDICDLPELVRVARASGARLMVDDAHATGVLGRTGAGTSEHFNLKGQVDLELGTFSKALAGVGGFVCGSEEVIEYLRFYANSYVFAATIPAPVAAGLIASLRVLRREPERIAALWRNITYFKSQLSALGFELERSASAIVPVVIGDYKQTLAMGRAVRARGLFCQTVVYPGVSRGEERLRLSVTSEHTTADLDLAVGVLADSARELGIIGVA